MNIKKLLILGVFILVGGCPAAGQNLEDSFSLIEELLSTQECSQILISEDLYNEFSECKKKYQKKRISYQKISTSSTYNYNFKRITSYKNEQLQKISFAEYLKKNCLYLIYTYDKLAPEEKCNLIWNGQLYGDTIILASYVSAHIVTIEEEIDAVLNIKIIPYDLSKILLYINTKNIIIQQLNGDSLTIHLE